ncbi:hypothetical protein VSR01_34655 [Actinacidiphila sp. DG2A-62]|nr:hypothetical protein [Actinacidiphila sp. DG2A-62]MEC3998357.1 hypothetical protein [Actinacidiphila sp. DG2A-62]
MAVSKAVTRSVAVTTTPRPPTVPADAFHTYWPGSANRCRTRPVRRSSRVSPVVAATARAGRPATVAGVIACTGPPASARHSTRGASSPGVSVRPSKA